MKHRLVMPVCLLLAMLSLASLSAKAQACPMCSDNLSAGPGGAASTIEADGLDQKVQTTPALAQGFAWSILLMMAVPYLALGGFGGYLYLHVRRRRLLAVATGASPAGGSGAA